MIVLAQPFLISLSATARLPGKTVSFPTGTTKLVRPGPFGFASGGL